MTIVLVGVSHKTAPVETRERLAVLDAQVPSVFESLLNVPAIRECAIISTCNRTELYAAGDGHERVTEALIAHLATRHGLPGHDLTPHLFRCAQHEAVRHLFSVSAGLDSMILGEGQILAQVRKAHQMSLDHRGAGPLVGKLFERAIRVGKRARAETRIAQGATSVGFAAVELARRVHGDLRKKRVLLVGTGKMGVLTLKLLVTAGAEKVTVVSRREESARRLVAEAASSLDAAYAPIERLTDALAEADIVISCTAAPMPVITAQAVRAAQRYRRGRPLFIVDIAVPRDVEPAVNALDDVFLYNVDDLSGVVSDSLAERTRETERVRLIIDDELDAFFRYCSSLETVPVIKQMRTAFERCRQREVDALLARERLTDEERQRFETFSRSLLARLLHEPTVRLKEMAGRSEAQDGLHLLLEVFGDGDAATEHQPPDAPQTLLEPLTGSPVDRQEEPAP